MASYAVSVVIPTYNRAHCIQRAVDSVLNQTFPPLEILVIDDGSVDGTEELFLDAPATVQYVRKSNGGVSSARNLGVSLARGNWIAFLDSDDAWMPTKLEEQVNCLRATNTVVCFTGTVLENGERHDGIQNLDPALGAGQYGSYRSPFEFIFKSEQHPMIQSLVVRKDVFVHAGGFDESLCVAEDTALFYDLVANQAVSLINAPLVGLTRERSTAGLSDSVDATRAASRYDCYIQVQARALAHVAGRRSPSIHGVRALRVIRNRLAYFISRRAEIAHAMGDHDLGQCLAREALRLSDDRRTSIRSFLLAYCYFLLKPGLKSKWPDSALCRSAF